MSFKPGVTGIIGKTIQHIVIKEGDRFPREQFFLVFTDDTHYEIYSTHGGMSGAGGVDRGGIEAVRAFGREQRIVLER